MDFPLKTVAACFLIITLVFSPISFARAKQQGSSNSVDAANEAVSNVSGSDSGDRSNSNIDVQFEVMSVGSPDEAKLALRHVTEVIAVDRRTNPNLNPPVLYIDDPEALPGLDESRRESRGRMIQTVLMLGRTLQIIFWDRDYISPITHKFDYYRVNLVIMRAVFSGVAIYTSIAISLRNNFSAPHALGAALTGLAASGYLQYMFGKKEWKTFFAPPKNMIPALQDMAQWAKGYGLQIIYLSLVRLPLLIQVLAKTDNDWAMTARWGKQIMISGAGAAWAGVPWVNYIISRFFENAQANPGSAKKAFDRNMVIIAVSFLGIAIYVASNPQLALTLQVPVGFAGIVLWKYKDIRNYLQANFRHPISRSLTLRSGLNQILRDARIVAFAKLRATGRIGTSLCSRVLNTVGSGD